MTSPKDDTYHLLDALAVAISEAPESRFEPERSGRVKVWEVYDFYRTVALNIGYYSAKLSALRRFNLWVEITLAFSASLTVALISTSRNFPAFVTVGIAVATLTAILAVVKPTFDFTNKLVHYQYALTSYQALSFDLQTLILTIRTKKEYGHPEQRQFYEIAERAKKIIFSRPKEQPDRRLLVSLQNEINRRFPVEGFYVPES